jgi:hypothetical protein
MQIRDHELVIVHHTHLLRLREAVTINSLTDHPALPAWSTDHLGGIARPLLYAWRILAEAVTLASRSSDLRLNLLGGIVLKADSRDEVQLGLQPLDVLLALDDQVLKELPRAGIALL